MNQLIANRAQAIMDQFEWHHFINIWNHHNHKTPSDLLIRGAITDYFENMNKYAFGAWRLLPEKEQTVRNFFKLTQEHQNYDEYETVMESATIALEKYQEGKERYKCTMCDIKIGKNNEIIAVNIVYDNNAFYTCNVYSTNVDFFADLNLKTHFYIYHGTVCMAGCLKTPIRFNSKQAQEMADRHGLKEG